MKKILLLGFIAICGFQSKAQWNKVSTLEVADSTGKVKYCYDMQAFGSTLYAGTEKGLFASTDNGITWSNKTYENSITKGKDEVHSIAMLNVKGVSSLLIGTKKYIFISKDNGATWTNISNGIDTTATIYSIVQMGDTLIAGFGQGYTAGGVYWSKDGGSTWTVSNASLPANMLRTLLVDGNLLYAGTKGVYLSSDRGLTWTSKSTGLPSGISVGSLVKKGIDFYAGDLTGGGVYKSTDNANSWDTIRNGLPTGFCQIFDMIENGGKIYIAEDGSPNPKPIYSTNDNGQNWTPFADSLPSGFFAPVLGQSANGSYLFTMKGFTGDIYRIGGQTGVYEKSRSAVKCQVFPNPASTSFTIQIDNNFQLKNVQFQLVNSLGMVVKSEEVKAHTVSIERGTLTQGIYFYSIVKEGMRVSMGKVIFN